MPNPLLQSPDAQAGSIGNRQRLALDNLLRRELKVGDPNDAQQIAQALADRYQLDARAQAIGGEARGLPFLQTPSLPALPSAAVTPTSLDVDQACNDVEQDLRELVGSNLAKDIRPELQGWQQALSAIIDDGLAAARQGLDPYSRDRAFSARRQLGEYARLARLVGALTPELNEEYRNLAQSLDEVSAVLLVLMGESIANTGFAGGRYLLRVPYSELQARRDRVLVALRNMSGSAQESLDQDIMPRGLAAYRELYQLFDRHGLSDLRPLLGEAELARAMDVMIQQASGGSSDGLRRIGATAWSTLNRFSRFVQLTLAQVVSDAPPLLAFQDSLQLFIDGFEGSGGFRLLRIARPSVLMYGLYGATALSNADQRLMALVQLRGDFATRIDCLTRCSCEPKELKKQIVLDRVLYDIDRAIDLYAVGLDDFGVPEQRAAARGFFITAMLADDWIEEESRPLLELDDDALTSRLGLIESVLMPSTSGWDKDSTSAFELLPGSPIARRMHDELVLQLQADRQWVQVVEQMSSGCIPVGDVFREFTGKRTPWTPAVPRPTTVLSGAKNFGLLAALQHGALLKLEDRAAWPEEDGSYRELDVVVPHHIDTSVGSVAGSLARQQQLLQDGLERLPAKRPGNNEGRPVSNKNRSSP
jgi:hypothetical protein